MTPGLFLISVIAAMTLSVLLYFTYYFAQGVKKGYRYARRNSNQDRQEDRSDDQSSPSVGFTEKVQSGRRFGDRQNRRTALQSGGKDGSKAQAR